MLGGIVMTTVLFMFFVLNEMELHQTVYATSTATLTKNDQIWDAIQASNPVYRFSFMLIVIMAASGMCISVFRDYEINYLHIFDIDYKYNLQQYQIWSLASIFAFFWCITFFMNIMYLILEHFCESSDVKKKSTIHEDIKYLFEHDYWSVILLLSFVLICFSPFKTYHKEARFELLSTLGNILIAPYPTVRFKDFFLADVITSMG